MVTARAAESANDNTMFDSSASDSFFDKEAATIGNLYLWKDGDLEALHSIEDDMRPG